MEAGTGIPRGTKRQVRSGFGRKREIGATEALKVDSKSTDPEQIGKAIEKAMADVRAEENEESRITTKIGQRKMYTIYIHKQSNSDSNRDIYVPNHDGGKDWRMKRGQEYIVPDYVVNILREAVGVQMEYDFEINPMGVKAINTVDRVPRFSFDIRGEITV